MIFPQKDYSFIFKIRYYYICYTWFENNYLFFFVISEEELKRLRAAVASDGAYHEIGFSYDNEVEKEETAGSKGKWFFKKNLSLFTWKKKKNIYFKDNKLQNSNQINENEHSVSFGSSFMSVFFCL